MMSCDTARERSTGIWRNPAPALSRPSGAFGDEHWHDIALAMCSRRAQLFRTNHVECEQVSSMARDHKNTVGHTGLMLWEAAQPLARFILACPALFQCESAASQEMCLAQPARRHTQRLMLGLPLRRAAPPAACTSRTVF